MPTWRRLGGALALLLLACSPSRRAASGRVDDLAALLPIAEVNREVGTLDFGTQEAREAMVGGWYPNERAEDGTTYVWSKGEVSELDFFLAAPRDLRLEMRCAPFLAAGLPQVVSVELNGRRLTNLELAPEMRGYAVQLPGTALAAGTNRLAFRYRTVTEPIRENRHQRLAVRWDLLRFVPVHQPAAEAPRAEKGGLYLPFGSEAVYYLELGSGGELALARIERRGAGSGGHLLVTAQAEGGKLARRVLSPGAAATLALPGRGPRLLRVGLRSVPAGSADRGGGLLLAAPAIRSARAPRLALAAAPARPWSGRPNIVLYLVDTLRADRLGCYGETKPLSPAIDAFARGATLFERAVAQATWTRPAVTSVLTGLGPLSHGVQTLDDRLPAAAVTLPEMLQAAGYRTAGFSTNLHVSAATGLAQGFDRFELLPGETRSDAVNRRVTRWLDDSRGKPPFFLYVQTLDPHAPYDPLPEMRRRFAAGVPPGLGATDEIVRTYPMRGEARARRIAQLSALYDAEVAGNDRSFGELLAALKERGLYDSALVVFMADHGEEFDEHGGLGHAINLYSPTLHVPLIVKWPREAEGRRVARLAQHVDLLPTLLAAAELRPPPGLPGTDLYPLAELPAAAPEDTGRAAFSHLSYAERQGMSLVTGGWKLILPLSRRFGRGPELYRLDADRDERDDLSDRDEVRAGWLLARIRRELLLAHPAHAAERVPIDEETRKALGALGYL